MTIGERIAQKRKEQNLSQEALGEALGVSRQSISKWESNNALPEIEKLIAMSRLFSVSVGWLLGVEEAPAEDVGETEDGGDELSEEQLRMIEELFRRYQQQPGQQKLSQEQRRQVEEALSQELRFETEDPAPLAASILERAVVLPGQEGAALELELTLAGGSRWRASLFREQGSFRFTPFLRCAPPDAGCAR